MMASQRTGLPRSLIGGIIKPTDAQGTGMAGTETAGCMQVSLRAGPTDQNIKIADLAEFADLAKIDDRVPESGPAVQSWALAKQKSFTLPFNGPKTTFPKQPETD
jgi:hypothetical protein